MNKAFLAIINLLLIVGCNQNPPHREPIEEEKFPGDFKESSDIAADRIAFLNRHLRLTPEEAKIFWPIYDQYIAEKEQLWRTQQSILFRSRPSLDISSEQAKVFIDSLLLIDKKILDNEEKYSARFLEILPPEKVLRMRHAEHHFKRHLLRQFQRGRSKN
ncbi:MAG TPA: hypothetical protein PK990_00705 [Salinivirgaceae bacterium]|nr:hypothetical protein [Salinivirgaceae bacterium]